MLRAIFLSLAFIAAATPVQAATIFATGVDWSDNGTVPSSNNRDNPLNALGGVNGTFLALGLTNQDGSNPGFAVFDFGQMFASGTVDIWETTFNCQPQANGSCSWAESARVYFGTDYAFGSNNYSDIMDDFTFAGELFNADAQNGGSLLINQAFRYIAVVDSTQANFAGGRSTEGFDIDAIGISSFAEFSQVPLPTAAFLMAPALLLLARRAQR